MIKEVIRFQNGMVLVFDERGEQMPEYQGSYKDVRAKILAHATQNAKFFHGTWSRSTPEYLKSKFAEMLDGVSREEW